MVPLVAVDRGLSNCDGAFGGLILSKVVSSALMKTMAERVHEKQDVKVEELGVLDFASWIELGKGMRSNSFKLVQNGNVFCRRYFVPFPSGDDNAETVGNHEQ